MSGTVKLALIIIVGVFAVYLAVKLLTVLLSSLLGLLIPLAIVGGIGYILYSLINKKSMGGGRRRYLP